MAENTKKEVTFKSTLSLNPHAKSFIPLQSAQKFQEPFMQCATQIQDKTIK